MGYKNAPAHFCRAIDQLVAEEGLGEGSATFVDDILTFGEEWGSYLSA